MAIRVPTSQRNVAEQALPGVAQRFGQPTGYEGVAKLGDAIGRVGEVAFGIAAKAQQEADESAVIQAELDFNTASTRITDEFKRVGAAAGGETIAKMQSEKISQLNESFNSIHASLTNRNQREAFVRRGGVGLMRGAYAVNDHAAQSINQYNIITSKKDSAQKQTALREFAPQTFKDGDKASVAVAQQKYGKQLELTVEAARNAFKRENGIPMDAEIPESMSSMEVMIEGNKVKVDRFAWQADKDATVSAIEQLSNEKEYASVNRAIDAGARRGHFTKEEVIKMKEGNSNGFLDYEGGRVASVLATGASAEDGKTNTQKLEEIKAAATASINDTIEQTFPDMPDQWRAEKRAQYGDEAARKAQKIYVERLNVNHQQASELLDGMISASMDKSNPRMPSETDFQRLDKLSLSVGNQARKMFRSDPEKFDSKLALAQVEAAFYSANPEERAKAWTSIDDKGNSVPSMIPGVMSGKPTMVQLLRAGYAKPDAEQILAIVNGTHTTVYDAGEMKGAVKLLYSGDDEKKKQVAYTALRSSQGREGVAV